MRRPIIIDCYTGSDDAMTLVKAFLSSKIDAIGIGIVGGNVFLGNITRNTSNIIHFLGCYDFKVAAGEERSSKQHLTSVSDVHSVVSTTNWTFEEKYTENLVSDNVRDFMVKRPNVSSEKVTIFALWFVSNLALLPKIFLKCKDKMNSIVLFTGPLYPCGNQTAAVMSNVLVGSENFRVILVCEIPLVACQLEIMNKGNLLDADKDRIRTMDFKDVTFVKTLFLICDVQFIGDNEMVTQDDLHEIVTDSRIQGVNPLPASLTMTFVVAPELFKGKKYYFVVECVREFTLGMTLVNMANYYQKPVRKTSCFWTVLTRKDS